MSLNDIIQIQNLRNKRKQDTFDKIYERVKIRINHTAKYGASNCVYEIPTIMYGLPSVDLKECCDFVEKKLKKEGFLIKRLSPISIFIDWEISSIEKVKKKREKRDLEKSKYKQLDDLETKAMEEMMNFMVKN